MGDAEIFLSIVIMFSQCHDNLLFVPQGFDVTSHINAKTDKSCTKYASENNGNLERKNDHQAGS